MPGHKTIRDFIDLGLDNIAQAYCGLASSPDTDPQEKQGQARHIWLHLGVVFRLGIHLFLFAILVHECTALIPPSAPSLICRQVRIWEMMDCELELDNGLACGMCLFIIQLGFTELEG